MTALTTEQLLEAVAGDDPCGEDLEYDPVFIDMEAAAAGRPEQQFGDTVIPGEEPNWKEVQAKAEELLVRSKDLRAASYLTRAAVHTRGLVGLRDGLSLLCGLVSDYWEQVHPKLDPDDGNDPTMRMNTILSLCDPSTTLRAVRDAMLVRSRGLGAISYRDVLVANGELPAPDGSSAHDMAALDGAFSDCELDELSNVTEVVKQSLEHALRLEQIITTQVGVSNAPSLSDLTDLLRAMYRLLNERRMRRGAFDTPAADPEANGDGESGEAQESTGDVPAAVATRLVPVAFASGEITSREEVIRALEKICQYYARHEPSSPVPLLLKRAQRLASKSFLDILRDLSPEAVQQVLAIGGITDDGSGDSGRSDDGYAS